MLRISHVEILLKTLKSLKQFETNSWMVETNSNHPELVTEKGPKFYKIFGSDQCFNY